MAATLTVDLNARIAQFETEMKRATGSLDKFGKRGDAVAAGMKAAFGALAAAVSVGAIVSFAKSSIDAADALKDMSDRLGVSIKDLASFKLAAEQSGTSLDGVGTGIAKLSRTIGQAEGGNKELAKALKDLGITARDPKEALFQLADAVQKMEDPNKRAALLSQVLGKSYGELVPFLMQGADALRESAKQSESFAQSMAKLAPDADKFNDQLALMKLNATGAASSLLVKLVPALNAVFERIGLVKSLIGAGGIFGTIAATVGTDKTAEVTARIRKGIKDTESAIATEKGKGKDTSGFEEKLRGLNAQLVVMKENSRAAALALGEQFKNYKVPQIPSLPGTIETPEEKAKSPRTGRSAARGIDKLDLFNDEMARNAKLIADETGRIAEDYAFMADVDLAQNTSEFAQAWIDAGAALTQDMLNPLEKANIEFARLQHLLDLGVISWETYGRATEKVQDTLEVIPDKISEIDKFSETMAKNIQDSFADFLFDPFDKGLKGMAEGFFTMIRKMVAEAAAAELARSLFGSSVSGGKGSGLFGDALKWVGSALFSANGNAFAGGQVQAFASGGIMGPMGGMLNRPTVFKMANGGIGIGGEAGVEAVMPLKRGKDGKLGVYSSGGGSGSVAVAVTFNDNRTQTESTSDSAESNTGPRIAEMIKGVVHAKLINEMRPGGLLA